MKQVKFSLGAIALVIAISASAFTSSKFATTFYANKTQVTPPVYVDVTTDVNNAGGPTAYAAIHCPAGTPVCLASSTDGGVHKTVLFNGKWQ